MEVTLKDVMDYWQNYCQRHDLDPDVMVQGKRLIALDHNYWADHPMQALKAKAIQQQKNKREETPMARLDCY